MSRTFSLEVKRNGQPTASPKEALSKAVRKLGYFDQKRINMIAVSAMEDFIARVSDTMRRKHGRGWPGGTGQSSLSRRSGRGLRSLTEGRIVRQPKSILAVFTLPRYLAFQEFGYLSTAKGKYLTIPLPAALNPDGTPKRRSARQWQNTFLVKGRRGDLTICTKKGRTIVPLYVLKPSVRIRPRLGLRQVMISEVKMLKSGVGRRLRELLKDAD